jgi:hypothetical protein
VILAHHGGETALVGALAGAVGLVPALLALGRARLGDFLDRLRERS